MYYLFKLGPQSHTCIISKTILKFMDKRWTDVNLPSHLLVLFPKNDEGNKQQTNQKCAKDGQHRDDHHIRIHLRNWEEKSDIHCYQIPLCHNWQKHYLFFIESSLQWVYDVNNSNVSQVNLELFLVTSLIVMYTGPCHSGI